MARSKEIKMIKFGFSLLEFLLLVSLTFLFFSILSYNDHIILSLMECYKHPAVDKSYCGYMTDELLEIVAFYLVTCGFISVILWGFYGFVLTARKIIRLRPLKKHNHDK
jgi:hypothetical protein